MNDHTPNVPTPRDVSARASWEVCVFILRDLQNSYRMKKLMKLTTRKASLLFAALLLVGHATIGAQTAPEKNPNITIKNFGKMADGYYRGAQPKPKHYAELKALGVDTVIDLRLHPTSYSRPAVESSGMRYVNIPMGDGDYPKEANIARFMQLINDPATGTIFVHCKGGKHRTGVTGAVYRFTKFGWDYDQVYREMKNYNFYSSWGYGEMKDFVQDYAAKMAAAEPTVGSDSKAANR